MISYTQPKFGFVFVFGRWDGSDIDKMWRGHRRWLVIVMLFEITINEGSIWFGVVMQ